MSRIDKFLEVASPVAKEAAKGIPDYRFFFAFDANHFNRHKLNSIK